MKLKRILSILLACLMLTGTLAVGANAWTDPEAKTKESYAIPLIGKYLAWPGEILITKLVLPQVLKLLPLDSLSLDGFVNKQTLEDILTAVDGMMPAELAALDLFGKLAPGLDATVAGVTDTATFASALTLALRPVLILGKLPLSFWNSIGMATPLVPDLAGGIAADYTVIKGALQALSAPNIKADAAIATADTAAGTIAGLLGQWIIDTMTELQTAASVPREPVLPAFPAAITAAELAKVDALVGGLVGPLFGAVESILANPQALIFEKLPNLLYNKDKIAAIFGINLFTQIGQLLGGGNNALLDGLESIADIIGDIDGFVEGMLGGMLSELGLTLKLTGDDGLIKKLTYAGDLNADGIVVADKTLVYNIIVNFLWNAVKDNKDAAVNYLSVLVPKVPKFVWTIAYYLVRALTWSFRI